MNPFLHSCVATPRGLPQASRMAARDPHRPRSRQAACRRRLASTVGALALAAGLGMASGAAVAVDLNTATVEQLQTLRGIGAKTAQIILDERQRGGPYDSLEDLSDRVRGIGPKRLQALQAAGLKVDAAPAAKAPAKPSR